MVKSIANWKLLVIFAPDIINMEERIFRLLLSTEADEFLLSLPEKVADKMRYNIRRVQKGERDPELFLKSSETRRFGSFALSITRWHIAFFHSGTQRKRHW